MKIYGISFFIISLLFIFWGYYLFFSQHQHWTHDSIFFFYLFALAIIPTIVFAILGLLTLLTKFRIVILIFLTIAEAITLYIDFPYIKRLFSIHRLWIFAPFRILPLLFFASSIYFFTRLKVKEQFK